MLFSIPHIVLINKRCVSIVYSKFDNFTSEIQAQLKRIQFS